MNLQSVLIITTEEGMCFILVAIAIFDALLLFAYSILSTNGNRLTQTQLRSVFRSVSPSYKREKQRSGVGGALLSMMGMGVGAGAIEMEIRSEIWIVSVSRRVVEANACRCIVS